MPGQGQLEIITANGEVGFYDLDSDQGITNIGRDLGNHIVIKSSGVSPFHAVLDHRQRPYHLIILGREGETWLSGQLLPPNVSVEVHPWDVVEFDGHSVTLLDDEAVGRPVALPQQAALLPAPGPTPSAAREPSGGLATLAPDRLDQTIVTELSQRDLTVEVEQSATMQLTIVNGGDIVASFGVRVDGLPGDWVTILPPQVNLYEGERAIVTIAISPPRLPTSRAGMHYFSVVVTSPNYPGRSSRRSATLVINPYYDFGMGELNPKRQTVSGRKRSGKASIAVTNKSNGEALFRVEGSDDERACSFEFQVPGEVVSLASQAEMRLSPEETVEVPIHITPHSRRLIGLRDRSHPFSITTTMLTGGQTPRTVLGDLASRAYIGIWHILCFAILMLALIVFTFWPRLTFSVSPTSVVAGQEVKMEWSAFPPIPFLIDLSLNGQEVAGPTSNKTDRPLKTTTYEMKANTWLSRLLFFMAATEAHEVAVEPVKPSILLFEAQPSQIATGKSTILSWLVVGADSVTLVNHTDGVEESLSNSVGSREIRPEKNTLYTLRAKSASSENPVEQAVEVVIGTPVAAFSRPVIAQFVVQPKAITAGQEVSVSWVVSGAEKVAIEPVATELPASGAVTHSPQQTTLYVLTASSGTETAKAIQQVVVGVEPTPTPTPTPGPAPVIVAFTVTPSEVVQKSDDGEFNPVWTQVNWLVTGETTNIEFSGGPAGYETVSQLGAKGKMSFDVDETSLFVLTAYNGTTKVVKTAQIDFIEPTPSPDDEDGGGGGGGGDDTATDAPTISSFIAEALGSGDSVTSEGGDPPTYEVEAGSNVNLLWTVDNADTVTLVGVGEQSTTGNYAIYNVIADRTIQLKAVNANGTTVATLKLQVKAKATPSAPYNVDGVATVNSSPPPAYNVTITWNYDDEDDIIGFRIYYDRNDGLGFVRGPTESELGSSTRQWTDPDGSSCTGYYVVAVYEDAVSGETKETDASSNTWYSPCP